MNIQFIVYKQENHPSGLDWHIRDNLGRHIGSFLSYDNAWGHIEFLQSQGK